MTSQPPFPTHEDLLRELVLGERTVDDPRIVRAFETDPELSRRWMELSETEGLLDGAGELERSVLGSAETAPTHPIAGQRVEATLRRLSRSGWSSLQRIVLGLAAAAVVIFTVQMFRSPSEPALQDNGEVAGGETSRPGGGFLGAVSVTPELQRPKTAADGFEVFGWSYDGGADWEGRCQVVVYTEFGEELARSPELLRPDGDGSASAWLWTPTVEEQELMHESGTIVWQVTATPLLGEPVSSELQTVP